jgi:hypothetical protein
MGQLLLEGGLLSLAGCVVGFGLAELAVVAIHKLPEGAIPRGEDIAVRWTVVVTLALIATSWGAPIPNPPCKHPPAAWARAPSAPGSAAGW